MKKYLSILILPLLVIAGCDSQQSASKTEAANTSSETKTKAAMKTTTEVAQPEVAAVTETTLEKETLAATPKVEVAAKAPLSGEQIYNKSCVNCHKSGVANAPKLGNTADWKARIEKGTDTLYQSAKNGLPGTAMMAKGTCGSCSDADLEAAVDYMVNQSK